MSETTTSTETAAKAAKASKAVAAQEQLSALEKRSASIAEKIQEKNRELRDLLAQQRKIDAQVREAKDRHLSDYLKETGLGQFSPEAWRAAEADIKALLAKNAASAGK